MLPALSGGQHLGAAAFGLHACHQSRHISTRRDTAGALRGKRIRTGGDRHACAMLSALLCQVHDAHAGILPHSESSDRLRCILPIDTLQTL